MQGLDKSQPPALRPEQRYASLGTVAFAAGKVPESAMLLTGPGKIVHVEPSGRIAWMNVACRNPVRAFYSDGYVYYDEGGVQKRIKYHLPCDCALAAEIVPEARRMTPSEKMKSDEALLDGFADRSGYSAAARLRP